MFSVVSPMSGMPLNRRFGRCEYCSTLSVSCSRAATLFSSFFIRSLHTFTLAVNVDNLLVRASILSRSSSGYNAAFNFDATRTSPKSSIIVSASLSVSMNNFLVVYRTDGFRFVFHRCRGAMSNNTTVNLFFDLVIN